MIGQPGVVSADDVCRAVEQVLREHLPSTIEQLGLDDRIKPIKEWQQVPAPQAVVSADFPVVAIVSTGLSGNPTRDGRGNTRATWRIGIAVYNRAGNHADTQGSVRDLCAAIRVTLLAHRSLDGLAETLTWVAEEYALYPQTQVARTFAGGAVGIDVTVRDVATLPPSAPDPVVQQVNPSVTPVHST